MGYYTAQEVAELTGTTYRTLMHWVEEELLRPEGAKGGKRKTTIWTDKHLREAYILSALRRMGFSLQRLRRAMDFLRGAGHNPLSTGRFLVIMGAEGEPEELVKLCTEGEAVELLKHPGQLVMRLWDGDGD